jgi:hypothetical protein
MARPRKDAKPAARAVRSGRERQTESGKRWRVRAYESTAGAPFVRVVFIHPDTGKPTSGVPEEARPSTRSSTRSRSGSTRTSRSARMSRTTGSRKRRNMDALGDLYLDWLTGKVCAPDYIASRKSLLNVWVPPVIGDLLVPNWDSHGSLRVIDQAHPTCRQRGYRTSARPSAGCGPRPIGSGPAAAGSAPTRTRSRRSATRRAAGSRGASSKWIPPHKLPETAMVEKAIEAAEELGRWEWLPDAIRTGGFCAARLAEQLGLRAMDVDLS